MNSFIASNHGNLILIIINEHLLQLLTAYPLSFTFEIINCMVFIRFHFFLSTETSSWNKYWKFFRLAIFFRLFSFFPFPRSRSLLVYFRRSFRSICWNLRQVLSSWFNHSIFSQDSDGVKTCSTNVRSSQIGIIHSPLLFLVCIHLFTSARNVRSEI